jgi:site-specific recombinase XerC
MKNDAMDTDASRGPEEAWGHALRHFDRELQRRGAAERTRHAYGADCGELAQWAAAQGLRPHEVGYPVLRRWAARVSTAGAAPRALARRMASARAFFRVLVEHGELRANPADLLSPELPQRLPRTLKAHEVARLLDRIPTTTPLELRDRAMFEIAYGCELRAEEIVNLDLRSVEFDAEQLGVLGKGSMTRFVPVGEPALRSVARYLERGRGALAGESDEPALFLSKTGRRLSTSDIRRRLRVWARHAAAQGAVRPRGSLSTTQVYTRVESARLRAAYERSHPRA